MEQKIKITYGGWYQRTTLHLSEIYNLFVGGSSNLDLDKNKLLEYQKSFGFLSVTREADYLEYVKAINKDGIEVRYYEDGLYILSEETDSLDKLKEEQANLENYFTNILNPGISYIFSLGAPTPKILANIKSDHPTVVSISCQNPEDFKPNFQDYGEAYSKIESGGMFVYKLKRHIFIISSLNNLEIVDRLVEMQIFFREFKDQLEKYLNIHRNIWEEISDIKEKKSLKWKEVEPIRSKLDSYQKTVSLITNRINQMGSYVKTRASIAKGYQTEDHLRKLFEFKFEVLTDTLEYIKEVWKMTTDYLNSAIQIIVEIKGQGTTRGVQSLQLITSIGVVSGLIAYFGKTEWPKFTNIGMFYFILIIIATFIINNAVTTIYKQKKYKLKFTERAKDI